MSGPSAEELDVVRNAVRQVVGDAKIAEFRDGDLALLWRQGFETKEALLAATSKQLLLINLPAALVAHVKAGECAGFVSAPSFKLHPQRGPVIGTNPN